MLDILLLIDDAVFDIIFKICFRESDHCIHAVVNLHHWMFPSDAIDDKQTDEKSPSVDPMDRKKNLYLYEVRR